MGVREAVDENFRFLVLEVSRQVDRARLALEGGDEHLEREIKRRDDYIDHLRTLIETKVFEFLNDHRDLPKGEVETVRAIDATAINLERIADHAVSIVRQAGRLHDRAFMARFDCDEFFARVREALTEVLPAQRSRDPAAAMQIAQAELELDRLYERKFERLLAEMEGGEGVADRVTALFIFHYLERMGDCLQNIGEAVISARVGERLKLYQYRNLRDGLRAARLQPGADGGGEEVGTAADELNFEGIWGTRSGSRIARVSEGGESPSADEVVFKEGDPEKLRREREAIERWTEAFPGLTPRVVDYREDENDAAILMEYLAGRTLYQMVLDADERAAEEATRAVIGQLGEIWRETRVDEPTAAGFVAQLRKRLDAVFHVHPTFRRDRQQIGALELPPFADLLDRAAPLDRELVAPFAVLGHGDFNIDNVIFDASDGSVHFIDLHRSGEMDYVQDVSVFLVSIFRIPTLGRERRELQERLLRTVLAFAREFARSAGDDTFDARLALGMARSLATSTRFEFQRSFARDMFQRAEFLLRCLVRHAQSEEPWAEFEIPAGALVDR